MKLVCDLEVALLAMNDYISNSIGNQGKYAMKEVWKDVKGFEDTHKVSTLGGVYTKPKEVVRYRDYGKGVKPSVYIRKGQRLKPTYTADGYLQITFRNTTHKVHRWVANTFLDNSENKPQVNHIDGIKDNNYILNLEWCTAKENVQHSYKLGLACNAGSRHPRSKLCEKRVVEIRDKRLKGISAKVLAEEYSVCISTIGKVLTRQYWGHI
tara:strand:- start:452 stop:1081 length:630 start_codon:yes stop_codon:yes gene_type:complete